MVELNPARLNKALRLQSTGGPGDQLPGAVIVDDGEGAMKSSGGIIQSNLEVKQIVELGEVLECYSNPIAPAQKGFQKSLEYGFVVYKSVGASVTDLTAVNALLSMARRKGSWFADP